MKLFLHKNNSRQRCVYTKYWAASEEALYLGSATVSPAGGATNILKYSFHALH